MQLSLQKLSFAYYKHNFTFLNIFYSWQLTYRTKTHIRLLGVPLDMSDAVDRNMARLRSSQALPVFSVFNSSSLLPDPVSLVTHYRGVADGFPLTQQKTGWNCMHVRVRVCDLQKE